MSRATISGQAPAVLTTGVVVIVACIPFAWAVITSLKSETNAMTFPPSFVPSPATLESYRRVVTQDSFLTGLWNSVAYAAGAVLLSLLVGVPAGYAAARMSPAVRRRVMLGVLASAMVPSVALLVPTYMILDAMGLLNSHLAIIVIMAARLCPQTVWFIENFVQALPPDIEEAALVDGARRRQVLLRLVVPLIAPGIAAVAILGIVSCWNDYVTVAAFAPALATRTLQVAIVDQVFDSIGVSWSFFMAFAIVSSMPIILLFLAAQRWFVAGLTAGAVKA